MEEYPRDHTRGMSHFTARVGGFAAMVLLGIIYQVSASSARDLPNRNFPTAITVAADTNAAAAHSDGAGVPPAARKTLAPWRTAGISRRSAAAAFQNRLVQSTSPLRRHCPRLRLGSAAPVGYPINFRPSASLRAAIRCWATGNSSCSASTRALPALGSTTSSAARTAAVLKMTVLSAPVGIIITTNRIHRRGDL